MTSTEKDLRGLTSETLGSVLFGRWPAWGGRHPTECQTQELLKTLPQGVQDLTPSTVRISASSVTGTPTLGVFATQPLSAGTEMGPCSGRLVDADSKLEQMATSLTPAWEVTSKGGESKILLLSDSGPRCWLSYVQCARHEREQNVETLQVSQEIFYRTTKFIESDEELLVWYGSDVAQYMGIPLCSLVNKDEQKIPEATSPTKVAAQSNTGGGSWKCVVCSRPFNTRSNLRSHMRIHTLQRPFVCMYCSRSFSQSSTLRNHVRLHTGERPYKCHVCQSAYSQLAGLRAHQKSARHSADKRNALEALSTSRDLTRYPSLMIIDH